MNVEESKSECLPSSKSTCAIIGHLLSCRFFLIQLNKKTLNLVRFLNTLTFPTVCSKVWSLLHLLCLAPPPFFCFFLKPDTGLSLLMCLLLCGLCLMFSLCCGYHTDVTYLMLLKKLDLCYSLNSNCINILSQNCTHKYPIMKMWFSFLSFFP